MRRSRGDKGTKCSLFYLTFTNTIFYAVHSPTLTVVAWIGLSCSGVYVSVCFPHDISKTVDARVIELDTEMFHPEI